MCSDIFKHKQNINDKLLEPSLIDFTFKIKLIIIKLKSNYTGSCSVKSHTLIEAWDFIFITREILKTYIVLNIIY